EEYTRALGQVMSGGWRQIALGQKLGVPDALGMTTEAWVRERIGGHVRLGLDERREGVKELTDPEGEVPLTPRQAPGVVGGGVGAVKSDLRGVQDRTAKDATLGEDRQSDVQARTPDAVAEPPAD